MRQRRAAGFSISVFGRFAYTLSALCGHYLGVFFGCFGFLVMSVHIRQCVREQPDTGYWKSLLAYLGAIPGCGGGYE